MVNPVVQKFLKTSGGFDFIDLPRFVVLECLGETHLGETYLLSERETGQLYVLKTQRDLSASTGNEASLLQGLSHIGLPDFDEVTERDGVRYIVRKYIEGETLEELIEKTQNHDIIVNIMIQICDILLYLHSQREPIIHRDIKPTNIIFNPKTGVVTLIDFGISRKFSKDVETDTIHIITPKFAPPEQYGFMQTDCRSDIYSLGVVLKYWLTGTANREAKIKNKALSRIVAKCTAFEPEARYKTAAAVKKAFNNYKRRNTRRFLAGIACFFTICLMAIAIPAMLSPQDELPILPEPPILPAFEIGSTEFRELANHGHSSYLRRINAPSLLYIEGEGLLVYDRTNSWDAVDINVDMFPPGRYTMVVELSTQYDDIYFELGFGSNPPWGVILYTYGNLIYDLTIENIDGISRADVTNLQGVQSYQRRLRIQTNWLGEDVPYPSFLIRSIRFYSR
jgi:hypothetical protein